MSAMFLIRNGACCASTVPRTFTAVVSIVWDFPVVRLSPIVFTSPSLLGSKKKGVLAWLLLVSQWAGKKCLIQDVLHD